VRKIDHVNDGKVLATDMIVSKTDVENYVKKLDEDRKFFNQRDHSSIPDLYKAVEDAYLWELGDTSSDDFQIVVDLREVFWKHAQRRAELDKGEME
jgi:hypothetical protein